MTPSRRCTSGIEATATTFSLNFAAIASGSPAGAAMPKYADTTRSDSPLSVALGTEGSKGERHPFLKGIPASTSSRDG